MTNDDATNPRNTLDHELTGPEGEAAAATLAARVRDLSDENARLRREIHERDQGAGDGPPQSTLDLMLDLLEGTEDVFFAKDLAGRYLAVNSAAARYLNRTRDEAIGLTDAEMMPAEFAAALRRADLSVIESGRAIGFETETVSKDGRNFEFQSYKAPYRDAQGNVIGILGYGRDVTQQRAAQRDRQQAFVALSQAEERMRNLMDAIPAFVSYLDQELCYRYVNLFYEEWFGVKREQIEGRPCREVLGELRFARAQPQLLAALEGESQQFDTMFEHADGSQRDLHCHIIPHFVSQTAQRCRSPHGDTGPFNSEVQGLVVVVTDVTAIKRAEVERVMLESADLERHRLGRELHDSVCQLITGAVMLAESIADDVPADRIPPWNQMIEVMREANRQARHLCNGLVPIEVDEVGLPGALRKLADDSVSMYSVACSFEGSNDILIWDEQIATQLYRIAQEAVHNAVKHASSSNIRIQLEQADELIRLSIVDDGCGFAAGLHPSGNGLRIMQHRARSIQAKLQIESGTTGEGTRITCELHQAIE